MSPVSPHLDQPLVPRQQGYWWQIYSQAAAPGEFLGVNPDFETVTAYLQRFDLFAEVNLISADKKVATLLVLNTTHSFRGGLLIMGWLIMFSISSIRYRITA
jgi:hypothetical protein